MRILLSGMVAGVPRQGGASWAVLQYLSGLADLGHEVLLVEPVELGDEQGALGRSTSARYFRDLPLVADGHPAALLRSGTKNTFGFAYSRLEEFARSADLLLNISGMLADERLLAPIPIRAFLDLDPGFNQVWSERGEDMGLERHTHFVSVGGRIGDPTCPIPTCGRSWIPTLPPVCLPHWPPAPAPERGAFTSVGHWRSYGSIEFRGLHYGQRAHSLRDLVTLPVQADSASGFELALGIHPGDSKDREALEKNGWRLLDPAVAETPTSYRQFIRQSLAEISIAKSGYVNSRSGWFSDRSACYLASGRPVVAQETGFSERLPTGAGLLSFETVEQAAEAARAVEGDWARHSRAARQLAEEHLDARKVLSALIEELGSAG